MTVKGDLGQKDSNEFLSVKTSDTVRVAFDLMKSKDISQLPVMDEGENIVGSLTGKQCLELPRWKTPCSIPTKRWQISWRSLPIVSLDLPFSQLNKFIDKNLDASASQTG
ncbi:CBS domain-containing protein [Okeania hirsuta]|uniref:CBS domain-containing protein n=1 Tax=Okeania hirsuta TaxID=1458930 RepID=UPI001960A11E|nr:CBS domain-containing protein [Okeania hirsuta]